MLDADRAALRAQIQAMLADAERQDRAAREAREDVTLDQQSVGRLSRVDALQRQAMARATAGRRQTEIRRLHAALDRIGDPEYGVCAECGDDIPVARLRIDPALMRCADCTRGG